MSANTGELAPTSAALSDPTSTSTTTPTSAPSDPPSTSITSSATPNEPAPKSQDAQPKHRPFPSVTGGCLCNTIRYRLLTAPLFCHACHCPDCQRLSGSAFGLFLSIETHHISILSPTRPVLVTQTRRPGLVSRHFECPSCHVELWSNYGIGPAVADVRVGTLDYPGLMEPDVHTFVESKLDWIVLPPGARSVSGKIDYRKIWPENSLKRLDIALARWAKKAAAVAKSGEGEAGDGEKTPTASGDVVDGGEDDEAFEKRFRETERALQERLEKLRKKLEDEEAGETGLEEATGKLGIADETGEKIKDGLVAEPVD